MRQIYSDCKSCSFPQHPPGSLHAEVTNEVIAKTMKYLHENYVSVVAVISDDADIILNQVRALDLALRDCFKYYEFIFVENYSSDSSLEILKSLDMKCTIVELAQKHKLSQAVRAGIDAAIGDYIFEIEDLSVDIDVTRLADMYETCQQGNDFVFLTPFSNGMMSGLFYRLLNSRLRYPAGQKITSSVCILSSRRAQNKVASVGDYIVNRNVAYASAGLDCAYIQTDIAYRNRRGMATNISFMVDTFIYYTDVAIWLLGMAAVFFLLISTCIGIYSVFSWLFGEIIAPGWTSTIMFISFGFSGIFAILAIVSRYLDQILKNTSHSKDYIFRDIVKKQ